MQRIRIIQMVTLLCALSACVTDPLENSDPLISSAADPVGNKRQNTSCDGRWNVISSVPSARGVTYSGAQAECSGRAQSGAVTLGNFIRENFGTYMDLSILGRGVQIYNCRTVRGGRSNSVHGDGRAVDIFIPTLPGGVADNAKGDRIANWLAENAAEIGIQYLIWDRGSFRGNRQPQSKCYTGSHPHNDHIHVELTWAAARSQTPFFTATDERDVAPLPAADPPLSTGAADDPYDGSDSSSDDPHGHGRDDDHGRAHDDDSIPVAEVVPTSWLGEPCNQDAQCIRSGNIPATCVIPAGTRWGFCSVSCDGLCPDRPGHAETFCATARMVGFNDIGLCMAKADSVNGYCTQYPDFEPFTAERFVDQSNYQSRTATVCAVAQPRSIASEDQTESDALALCGDTQLPLSDHGRRCAPQDEERWRCACSERFETTVSQVCRRGAWVNNDLDPRDCSRCNGTYSDGCEPY